MKKVRNFLFAFSAIAIGLYPIAYFVVDPRFGLLSTKSKELLSDMLWNGMFYAHIIFGGIALFIGWIQFNKNIQQKRIALHRFVGKLYLFAVLLSGISSLYVGYFATGGIIAKLGFVSLGMVWLYTSIRGFIAVKNKNIALHQKMMIYSYAACFAAVTLRIWLPSLTALLGDFIPAYRIVAWLAWVPNIAVAHYIIQHRFKPPTPI